VSATIEPMVEQASRALNVLKMGGAKVWQLPDGWWRSTVSCAPGIGVGSDPLHAARGTIESVSRLYRLAPNRTINLRNLDALEQRSDRIAEAYRLAGGDIYAPDERGEVLS
jgi:hypothetical protein